MINKKISKLFLKTIMLLIFSYQLRNNNNYISNFSQNKIIKYLKNKFVDDKIITYGILNFNFDGYFYYLKNEANTTCIILITKTEINVIFTGSRLTSGFVSMIKDSITNFNLGIKILNFNNLKIGIHKPYHKNMHCSNLIEKIIYIILKYKDKKLIISGHSAGSGCATYLSLMLHEKYNYKKKLKLVLISSPKLGNENLSKYIQNNKNIQLYTMINNYELPPLFPFYPFFSSYSNIGNKIYRYKYDGTCEIFNSMPNNLFIYSSIKDHRCIYSIISIYANIISKNIK